MNKELINKYKPEFDHWLNGGSVLINSDLGWCPIAREFTWSCNISVNALLVINDEYSEFRKALAEGKIVQYLGQYSNMWHEVQEPDFNLHPTCYRIKPDEPKFKVGDFVRCVAQLQNASPLRITRLFQDNYHVMNSKLSFLEYELIPWTPVKGEWCWFWDKCTPHRPTLRQYDIFPEGYGEENMFHDSEQNPFDFCEPFLKSRPSHLKDK